MKRYDPNPYIRQLMDECEDGDWVKWDDVKSLIDKTDSYLSMMKGLRFDEDGVYLKELPPAKDLEQLGKAMDRDLPADANINFPHGLKP